MSSFTRGSYYVAERCRWNGDVRMVRTDADKSAVIGVTSDKDAPLFAAAPDLLAACEAWIAQRREDEATIGYHIEVEAGSVASKIIEAVAKAKGKPVE